jgi:hypothetical protein
MMLETTFSEVVKTWQSALNREEDDGTGVI